MVESETSLRRYTTATELGKGYLRLKMQCCISREKRILAVPWSIHWSSLEKWRMLKVSCISMETLVLFIKNVCKNSFWLTQTPKGLCRVLASTGHNWSCCCSIPLGVSCCLSRWDKATWKCSFARGHAWGKQRYLQRVTCCLPLMKRCMIWMVLLCLAN